MKKYVYVGLIFGLVLLAISVLFYVQGVPLKGPSLADSESLRLRQLESSKEHIRIAALRHLSLLPKSFPSVYPKLIPGMLSKASVRETMAISAYLTRFEERSAPLLIRAISKHGVETQFRIGLTFISFRKLSVTSLEKLKQVMIHSSHQRIRCQGLRVWHSLQKDKKKQRDLYVLSLKDKHRLVRSLALELLEGLESSLLTSIRGELQHALRVEKNSALKEKLKKFLEKLTSPKKGM